MSDLLKIKTIFNSLHKYIKTDPRSSFDTIFTMLKLIIAIFVFVSTIIYSISIKNNNLNKTALNDSTMTKHFFENIGLAVLCSVGSIIIQLFLRNKTYNTDFFKLLGRKIVITILGTLILNLFLETSGFNRWMKRNDENNIYNKTFLNEQKNDTNKTTSDEPFIKSLGYSTIVVLLVIIAIVSVILLIITYYGSKKSINFISNIHYNLGFNNYILYYFSKKIKNVN